MAEGVDALGHPDPDAVVAAGKTFVCCYLKNISRAQIDAYLTRGTKVVLISETTGRASLGGTGAGQAEALADRAKLTALGAPATVAVYSAEDDFDVQASQVPSLLAFMRGYSGVLGVERTGFYGGRRAITAVLDAGLAKYGWQTYGWSQGQWDKRAQLEQYLNGQSFFGTVVDFDRSTATDFGAWGATTGDDVPLTPAEYAAIADEVWTRFTHNGKNLAEVLEKAADDIAALRATPAVSGGVDIPALASAVAAELAKRLAT